MVHVCISTTRIHTIHLPLSVNTPVDTNSRSELTKEEGGEAAELSSSFSCSRSVEIAAVNPFVRGAAVRGLSQDSSAPPSIPPSFLSVVGEEQGVVDVDVEGEGDGEGVVELCTCNS